MDCNRRARLLSYTALWIGTTFALSTIVYFFYVSRESAFKMHNHTEEQMEELWKTALSSGGPQETEKIVATIEATIQERMGPLWDELYAVKSEAGRTRTCGADEKYGLGKNVDEVTRPNFADEKLGAKILEVSAEPFCATNFLLKFFGMDYCSNPPILMLRPSMSAGNCFGFRGKACVTIRLAYEIFIESVEIRHISSNMSPTSETSSAPKTFKLYGITKTTSHHLGDFTYNNKNTVEVFPVKSTCKYLLLRVQFESNHGHPDYTCVYRFAESIRER